MFSIGKVNAALAAAIVFLLLSSCSAYLAFSRLHTSENWVHHTRGVQSALARFAMSTARAGRLRAEYVDSGDPSLLEQQADVIVEVRNTASSIQRLTADNAQEQVNAGKLTTLMEKRIALMDQAVALKRSGKSSLLSQAQITRQIVSVAQETDVLLQGMYDAEEQLLAERQRRVSSSTTLTQAVLITSLFLAMVLFLVHHQLLMEQVKARSRAETTQRALSARLLTLQDAERRKFARELHDSVGQHLAAMKMALSMLTAKLPGDKTLEDSMKMLDDSITETRTISHLLHPPLLDEAGLNSASRWFVEGFGKRSGIRIDLDILEGEQRLPEETELVLFRVLQESLTNVHRHSGTTQAKVSLHTSGDEAILRVTDFGRGMPPGVLQSLREDGPDRGVGLAGMNERVREIGGRLNIRSSSAGTEIVARVPVRPRPVARNSPAPMQEVEG